MIQKDIPIFPNSVKNDGFKMIPKTIFNQINNNVLIYRRNEIEIDKKIAEENHHDDIIKYKYYKEFFSIIQKDIYELFNEKLFWKYNMDKRVCDFEIKSGKHIGLLCGKRVDIKCNDRNGYYRCSSHVSSKYYKPKINKNKIDKDNLCIAKIGYKQSFNCNMFKKYGNYCIYHLKENIGIDNSEKAKIYHKEVTSLSNLIVEPTNNSIMKSNKYNCKIDKKIDIIDIYEKNGYKEVKLICYYNENSRNKQNYEELIFNSVHNFYDISFKKENKLEYSKKIYNECIDLNIKIDNWKKKLQLIDEILNINNKCDIRNCNKIKNLFLTKSFYCKDHALNTLNTYSKSKYIFNSWNYL
jgi:hypothetical protein